MFIQILTSAVNLTSETEKSFIDISILFLKENGFLVGGICLFLIGLFFLLNGRARESGCLSGLASILMIIVGAGIAIFGYIDQPLDFREIFQYTYNDPRFEE